MSSTTGVYVIVNNETKTLVVRITGFITCYKELEKLNAVNNVHSWHNVTHPRCPKWVKSLAQDQWFYSQFKVA
jgi:hypothetical protein